MSTNFPGFTPRPDPWYENLAEKLNPLEVLNLPSLMLSEGYGKYQETEDPTAAIGAALKAFYRGSDEREYGTMGDQLMPKEIGEGWGRKIARFGVDVGTDPLLLFPGTIGAKTAKLAAAPWKAGYRGAQMLPGVGKFFPSGKAIGEALQKSKAGQTMAKWLLPMGTFAETYGGVAGKMFGRRSTRMLENAEIEAAPYLEGFADALKQAGLGSFRRMFQKGQPAELITKAMEAGTTTGVKGWDDVGVHARAAFDDILNRMTQYKDRYGKGFEVFNPKTAKWEPLAQHVQPNYVPQILKREVIESMMSKTDDEAIKYLMRELGSTKEAARQVFNRVKRAGNIEFARTAKLPEHLREMDIGEIFGRYVNQWATRSAFGKEFGLNGKGLKSLLKRMSGAGVDPETIKDIYAAMSGGQKYSAFGLDKLTRGIMGYQVLSKMGPASTIANLSQQANTFVTEGGVNMLRGAVRAFTPRGFRQGMRAFSRGHENAMQQLVGGQRGWVSPYLSAVGFNVGEMANRIGAANAGIASAERMLGETGGRLTAALRRRGLNSNSVRAWQELGYLPDFKDLARLEATMGREAASDAVRTATRVGLRASNKTQHANRVVDIPITWRSPEMKMFLQYKSFIYQQSRFLMREIADPAFQFFRTNGAKGSLAPLYRAAAGFGIAGPAVGELRDQLKSKASELVGAKYQDRYKFDFDDPGLSLLRGMTYVGGFGMFGDIANAAYQGRFTDWLLGPTVSDAADIMNRTAQWGYDYATEGEVPDADEVYGEIYRRTLRGMLPASPQFVGQALGRTF